MRRTRRWRMQFINFILQPDVIAGITNTVHYPNAVTASRDKIDAGGA